MLLGNIGAMGYFLFGNPPSVGIGMLGVTAALSSVMGVTLTSAIGGLLFGLIAVSTVVGLSGYVIVVKIFFAAGLTGLTSSHYRICIDIFFFI